MSGIKSAVAKFVDLSHTGLSISQHLGPSLCDINMRFRDSLPVYCYTQLRKRCRKPKVQQCVRQEFPVCSWALHALGWFSVMEIYAIIAYSGNFEMLGLYTTGQLRQL